MFSSLGYVLVVIVACILSTEATDSSCSSLMPMLCELELRPLLKRVIYIDWVCRLISSSLLDAGQHFGLLAEQCLKLMGECLKLIEYQKAFMAEVKEKK